MCFSNSLVIHDLLDQQLALPSESYLVPYFNNVDAYLDVGPPVYFISKDIDVSHWSGQQALCGRFMVCFIIIILFNLFLLPVIVHHHHGTI